MIHTVRSSKETLTIDYNGRIIERNVVTPRLTQITRFDLIEWRRFWRETTLPETFEIVDLGYWFVLDAEQIVYEPPDFIWRRNHAQATKKPN